MARRKLLVILLCAFAFLAAGGCGANSGRPADPTGDAIAGGELARGGPLLEYFQATYPGQDVIIYDRADLNNDQTEDLVVIFKESKEKNSMLVVIDAQGSYQCTNAMPAPATDQVIQFRDIDKKPPLEFIVQGRKGANYGYAIYRVEGTYLEDLFGEGMKDCC